MSDEYLRPEIGDLVRALPALGVGQPNGLVTKVFSDRRRDRYPDATTKAPFILLRWGAKTMQGQWIDFQVYDDPERGYDRIERCIFALRVGLSGAIVRNERRYLVFPRTWDPAETADYEDDDWGKLGRTLTMLARGR